MILNGQGIKDLIDFIENDCKEIMLPPERGLDAIGQPVIPFVLVRKTRDYIERIVHQINGSYSQGYYDACAVMIRRLIETLIIEAFENNHIADKIKDSSGDFYYLSKLIPLTLNESKWNLGRNAKQSLPKLKDIGDKSAHSRRFLAIRPDIDNIILDIRNVIQELISVAKLK
jgi:hypothetical protein